MRSREKFRILISIVSVAIGIFLFSFAMHKGLTKEIALLLGIAPFARTFLKIAYEIRRGETECRYLSFIKTFSNEKSEQDNKYHPSQ